ncbi:hypothetical protein D3C80_2168660 [compost metagenome]
MGIRGANRLALEINLHEHAQENREGAPADGLDAAAGKDAADSAPYSRLHPFRSGAHSAD